MGWRLISDKVCAARPTQHLVKRMNGSRFIALAVILIGCVSVNLSRAAATVDRSSIAFVELQPKQGPLQVLLAAETQKARSLNRTLFVEVSATWCGPCKRLVSALSSNEPLMRDAFSGTYVVHVDLDRWKGQLQQLGFAHAGVPVFYGVDRLGRPTGAIIDGSAWGADTPENMAPPLKAFFQSQATATQ